MSLERLLIIMLKTPEARLVPCHVPPDQVSTLMQALNQNFKHILPKKRIFNSEAAKMPQTSPKVCLELIEQYEITLQLLVQNLLFCDDLETKQLSAKIFVEIINKKNDLLEQIFLPAYNVCLNDFVDPSHPRNSAARKSRLCLQ